MQNLIRLHDKTTHNGRVISCSPTMSFDDLGVARKGDLIDCPEHGINPIIEGDPDFTDDGIPVALHGHRGACGCTLISSLLGCGIE
jgi:uncharacterized Zn-binding protein involved in type VI secretion